MASKKTRADKEREEEKRRRDEKNKSHLCKNIVIDLPKPLEPGTVEQKLEYGSPGTSKSKIQPTHSGTLDDIPEPPDKDDLKVKKPKSGIFINVKEEEVAAKVDSIEEGFKKAHDRKQRRLRRKPEDAGGEDGASSDTEDDDYYGAYHIEGDDDEEERRKKRKQSGESGDARKSTAEAMPPEISYTARKKVSLLSASTSLDPNEFFTPFESFEDKNVLQKLIQKYRRESDALAVQKAAAVTAGETGGFEKKCLLKGTLESHSFTETKQTGKVQHYGLKRGSLHQGDERFPKRSRNKQGICMAVSAYCYNVMKHPQKWDGNCIDEVLETGDRLYRDTMDGLHAHSAKTDIEPEDLHRFCYIGSKRIRFKLHEAEIAGSMKSDDKTVYNITKGLKLFFNKHCTGILQSYGMNLLIWKLTDFYLFDATARNDELEPDAERGTAILIRMFDVMAVASILLNVYK